MPKRTKRSRIETTDFTIVVDTREQRPFSFIGFRGRSGRLIVPRIKYAALKTGDYSIVGMEDRITVERKSMEDLFGVVGRDRERFVRELGRLSKFDFAAIVIEATYKDIALNPPQYTQINPTSVINSLLAWQVQFGVHVIPMPTRRDAELATFKIIQSFHKRILATLDYGQ